MRKLKYLILLIFISQLLGVENQIQENRKYWNVYITLNSGEDAKYESIIMTDSIVYCHKLFKGESIQLSNIRSIKIKTRRGLIFGGLFGAIIAYNYANSIERTSGYWSSTGAVNGVISPRVYASKTERASSGEKTVYSLFGFTIGAMAGNIISNKWHEIYTVD
ncbi:MAG: hypothetical protein ISR95_07495 [Candidatus Marinimicrobia bacterium]|nr:hypothetical protein [Candidatus Neomarinimicrobiota bacterium]MBL7047448.1 hypothetical protein [Candidatus Neomarinimicrobiota bacterium]